MARSDIVIGLTTTPSTSGFISVQSIGAMFDQQSNISNGRIPTGTSVVGLRNKRGTIILGVGGYASAHYGE